MYNKTFYTVKTRGKMLIFDQPGICCLPQNLSFFHNICFTPQNNFCTLVQLTRTTSVHLSNWPEQLLYTSLTRITPIHCLTDQNISCTFVIWVVKFLDICVTQNIVFLIFLEMVRTSFEYLDECQTIRSTCVMRKFRKTVLLKNISCVKFDILSRRNRSLFFLSKGRRRLRNKNVNRMNYIIKEIKNN